MLTLIFLANLSSSIIKVLMLPLQSSRIITAGSSSKNALNLKPFSHNTGFNKSTVKLITALWSDLNKLNKISCSVNVSSTVISCSLICCRIKVFNVPSQFLFWINKVCSKKLFAQSVVYSAYN